MKLGDYVKKVDIMFSEIGYYSESDVKNLDKTVFNKSAEYFLSG